MLTIFHGRPENCSSREPREVRVYDLLDRLNVEYDRLDHEPAATMEICAEIDAAFERMPLTAFKAAENADKSSHPIICKNLFLTNKQQTKFYLLMMPGDKKFITRLLSQQINSARLSFAGEELMLKYLDLRPGSVSVLGLMNDLNNDVQLLIDEDILQSEMVGCHPCINTSSLRLKIKDLVDAILPAINHSPTFVHLNEE